MRKILSLVLVLSLVLGSMSFAFAAPSDVVGTDYEDAVNKLMAVGVINGYEDGTFKPDNTITRAEFAAIVVRTLGLEAAALKGATPFNDVPADHWASGYVSIASSMGVINGMGDGTFAPSAPVTFEQAVTMIVRALGYDEAAKAKGGYPSGYLVIAAQEDITDDVNGTVGAAAARGIVAQLVDNSLEVPLMVQTGYGDERKFVKSGTDGTEEETLLENKLNVTKVKERVVDIPRTDSKLEDNEIELDDYGVAEVVEGFNSEAVYGVKATLYINDDGVIVDYSLSDDVYYDAIVDVDEDELTLSTSEDNYDFSKDIKIELDGNKVAAKDLTATYSYAKVVVDGDDEVVFLEIYTLDDFIVIQEVDDYLAVSFDGDELDLEDFTIVKEGKEISIDDLEVEDILFYDNGADYAEVYSNTTTGEIENVFTTTFRVDGEDFDIAGKYLDDEDMDALTTDVLDDMEATEESVVVFVDREGDVVLVKGDLGESTTSTVVGVFTQTVNTYQDNRNSEWFFALDFVNDQGEEIALDVKATDVDVDIIKTWATVDADDNKVADNDVAIAALAGVDKSEIDWSKYSGSEKDVITNHFMQNLWAGATKNVVKNDVFKYKVDEDNDVTSVYFNLSVDRNVLNVEIDDNYANGHKLSSSVLVFDVTDGTAEGDTVVSDWKDVAFDEMKDGDIYYGSDGYVDYIVVTSSDEEENVDEYLALITDVDELTGGDEWRIKAFVDGDEKTFYTDDSITAVTAGAGDVAVIYVDKDSGKISKYTTGGVADTEIDAKTPAVTNALTTNIAVADKEVTVGSSVYELVSGGRVYDISGSTIKEISLRDIVENADGITVVLEKDAADQFAQFILLKTDASDNAGGTPPTGPSGDYTVVNVNTVLNKLTLKDSDNNVKVFELPLGDNTLVEDDDGTVQTTIAASQLSVNDEINIVLTEGTNDVTYITVKVNK